MLGMCLQLVFVLILWLILRRFGGKTVSPTRHAHTENGRLKNGSVVCKENDYQQCNGKYYKNLYNISLCRKKE